MASRLHDVGTLAMLRCPQHNTPATINDVALARQMAPTLERVIGLDKVEMIDPTMGGEDFAVYLDHVPGAQVRLGCAGDANWPLLHSPVFDVDEQVIGTGARVVSQAALQLLQHRQESEFQI